MLRRIYEMHFNLSLGRTEIDPYKVESVNIMAQFKELVKSTFEVQS